MHIVASTLATFTGIQYLKKPLGAGGAFVVSAFSTLTLGLAKEFLIDKTPSEGDAIANCFGVILGTSIAIPLEF